MDLSQISDDQLSQIAGAANTPAVPPISAAILGQESRNKANAPTSVDGAVGRAQIEPSTFAQYALPGEHINNDADNLAVHNRIISDLSQKTGGDPARIAVGYFSGSGNIAPAGSPTPFKHDYKDGNGKSVSSYVSDVVGRMPQYADSGQIKTDAQIDSPDVSQYSDEQLAQIAGTNAKPAQAANPAPQGQQQRPAPVDNRFMGNEPGFEHAGILPFKTDLKTGKNIWWDNGLVAPEMIRSPVRGMQDLQTLAANKSTDTTPDAVNAMMALGAPAMTKGIPTETPPSGVTGMIPALIKDEGSGSPPILDKLPLPKLVVDNSSGSPIPKFMQKPEPIPAAVLKTDAGQPLIVSPKAIPAAHENIAEIASMDAANGKPLDFNQVASRLEEMQKTNPDAMALDAMQQEKGGVATQGRNMSLAAKAVANTPGQAAGLAGDASARGYNAIDRISGALDSNLTGADYYKTQEALNTQKSASGTYFKQAFKGNASMDSPELNRVLATPEGNAALKQAARIMLNNRKNVVMSDPELVEQAKLAGSYEPGQGGIGKGLNMETLHYTKMALDSAYQNAFTAAGYKDTPFTRSILNVKNDLLGEMDSLDSTGLYAKGRSSYADPAAAQTALEQGRNWKKLDPEEIQAFFKDKTTAPNEKTAFITGVRRDLADYLAPKRDGSNPIEQFWTKATRDKLRPMFPDQASFDKFATTMQNEQIMARNNRLLATGSPTASNLNFNEMFNKKGVSSGDIAKTIIEPQGALANYVGAALDKRSQGMLDKMSNDQKTIFMRYLTTKDPAVLRDLQTRINPKSMKNTGTK